ncbi:Hypothetical predicted protein [Octopus vulgaris]|uniref:Uncharacterized protein n=1 Tax=Octopus vulgaris TaxID=6645 RepID=A0AA36EX86_OCTVU|nr:Hypothetical predicted protein [Octopus vulgaris]
MAVSRDVDVSIAVPNSLKKVIFLTIAFHYAIFAVVIKAKTSQNIVGDFVGATVQYSLNITLKNTGFGYKGKILLLLLLLLLFSFPSYSDRIDAEILYFVIKTFSGEKSLQSHSSDKKRLDGSCDGMQEALTIWDLAYENRLTTGLYFRDSTYKCPEKDKLHQIENVTKEPLLPRQEPKTQSRIRHMPYDKNSDICASVSRYYNGKSILI